MLAHPVTTASTHPPRQLNGGPRQSAVYLVGPQGVETVCPSFYVLAHATGCAFSPQCSYCYLRDRSQYPPGSHARSDAALMLAEISGWIGRDNLETFVLNAGNLSDSLCFEDSRPLMPQLVELFRAEAENRGRPHTLLLVTKGGLRHCQHLLDIRPSRNVIISFSMNCPEAAARHEAGAATPSERFVAARGLGDLGWRIRVRIDPLMLGCDYGETVEQVRLIAPERVTLGCLRADGKLMDYAPAGVLADLKRSDEREGCWHYPLADRLSLYRPIVQALRDTCSLGLCEEPPQVWDALGLPKEHRTCNCNHI